MDTSIFIFQVEGNPRYSEFVSEIFGWLETPKAHAVTSTITMLELLIQPYRFSDMESVNTFYALLSTYPNLDWMDLTLDIADRAAQLRVDYNLRTPDAVQLATALDSGATGFISNDKVFKRATGLDVILLDDLRPKVPRSPK